MRLQSCLKVAHPTRHVPTDIGFYEGLVRATASLTAPRVELEFDDIASILRIAVWRALEAYDPRRSRLPVERYTFMCVKNRQKDLLGRRRRGELSLEELSGDGRSGRDALEERYLAADADEVYGDIERELPTIPSTLTELERQVLVRLYMAFSQRETAEQLGLTRSEMERVVRSLRTKMADWRPSRAVVAVAA